MAVSAFGSRISKDHQFDLWKRLYTEEEAQAINEMPMYERFTAAEFAEICGKSVGDCTKLCNQIADKGMLHREHDDDGETRFFVVGSEYGYYEANIFNIDADFLKLKDATGSEDIDGRTSNSSTLARACIEATRSTSMWWLMATIPNGKIGVRYSRATTPSRSRHAFAAAGSSFRQARLPTRGRFSIRA